MSDKNFSYMKTIDLIAAIFLFVGGINWGLVALREGFFMSSQTPAF